MPCLYSVFNIFISILSIKNCKEKESHETLCPNFWLVVSLHFILFQCLKSRFHKELNSTELQERNFVVALSLIVYNKARFLLIPWYIILSYEVGGSLKRFISVKCQNSLSHQSKLANRCVRERGSWQRQVTEGIITTHTYTHTNNVATNTSDYGPQLRCCWT